MKLEYLQSQKAINEVSAKEYNLLLYNEILYTPIKTFLITLLFIY